MTKGADLIPFERIQRASYLLRGAVHRPGLPPWGVVAALWLAVPWWGWGQSNALNKVTQPAGAPIRLSALHPWQLEELKGRPLCVYNFTTW
jgi:hypothetical protein